MIYHLIVVLLEQLHQLYRRAIRIQQGQFGDPVFRAFWDTVFAAFQRLISDFQSHNGWGSQ